jgi:predicted transcriptional regulator of viral defense system
MKKHKKLNLLLVQKELKNKGLSVFTPKEFERVFDVPATAARQFIHAYIEKKFFSKLRNGLYAVEGERPNLYFAANKIYRPSYISLETALSYYHIIPETVYSVTSVTPKSTSSFDAFGIDFSYTKIKQAAFTGYTTKKEGGVTFHIAEPEKALADYLYLVSLGKKKLNDRTDVKQLDKKKTREYTLLFNRPKLRILLDEAWEMEPPPLL